MTFSNCQSRSDVTQSVALTVYSELVGGSTCDPGHDPFQEPQGHCSQGAPHHGALLSSAQVRFQQR